MLWTVVMEKTPESPLDCKEIKSVHPKGNQSWIFIGRTDAEAETLTLWPPDVKNWVIGKDPHAGKDWRQEKGATEDKMVGWHHRLDGHGFEWTLGVSEGQEGLACYGSWGCKESDTTERLNWTEFTLGIHVSLLSIYSLFFRINFRARLPSWQIFLHRLDTNLPLFIKAYEIIFSPMNMMDNLN